MSFSHFAQTSRETELVMDLSTLDDDELTSALIPLTKKMNDLCTTLEQNIPDPRTISDMDREARELFQEAYPYQKEFARRYPLHHRVQQNFRDFKRYGRTLRGTV